MLTDRNQGVFRSSFLVLTNDGSPHFSLFTSNIYFCDWMFQFKRDKLLEETSATLSFHIYSLHIHNIRRQYIYSYRSESLFVYREKLHSGLLGSFSFSIRNCNFRCGILRSKMVTISRHQSIAFSCLICLFDVFRPTSVVPISSKMRTWFSFIPPHPLKKNIYL